jgi:hypothetical protein
MNDQNRDAVIRVVKLVAAALLGGTLIAGVLRPLAARADPKPGLWQEAVTQADGVTVRVIRDTTQGNFNVCYVASEMSHTGDISHPPSISVAISCVPERKP